MRSEWKKARIRKVCDSVSLTHKLQQDKIILINTSDVFDGKVLNHQPVINQNLRGQFKKSFQKDDILYSEIRPKNKRFAYVDFDAANYVASTKLMVLRSHKEKINPLYLFQILKNDRILDHLQLLAETRSGTFPQITFSELGNIEIALPSLSEQQAISATLSCLDDKIELNNKINANLEAQAQAIFKNWFVDFEPFQDGEFEESEHGEIPVEWSIQAIEYIAEKVAMGPFGSNIKVETFVDSGVPIISGNHLRGLYLDEASYNFITNEHANKLKNSLVHAGDIVFTHAGNIGQVALIPEDCDYPCYIISQRQFYLRCNKEKVLPEYINYYFHSREGQGKLLANASQTGVPSLARPSSHLKSIVVPLPPITVQIKWLETVRPMLQTFNHKKKENKRLSAIRDALLPKLMSGEIEVPIE